ncbi:hypothetical protein J2T17_007192 [Paenibacillus mucilaginosus]|uniref:FixH family protein n=1 Tax=Paenibacillus mucilaginosus TaxID=61624 RepID=UPI003D1C2215
MNIYARYLAATLYVGLLTACSVDREAVSHYKQESPIHIDISLPEPFILNTPMTITATLNQNGVSVKNAEYVDFTIWEKGSLNREKIEGENDGSGVYHVKYTATKNGTYYVKVAASANGSKIMPTKQFILGEIAEEISIPKQDNTQHHQHH